MVLGYANFRDVYIAPGRKINLHMDGPAIGQNLMLPQI
jgi:hypothetical protein